MFDDIPRLTCRSVYTIYVVRPTSPARITPDTLSYLEAGAMCTIIYCLRSLILFHGIAKPTFIANTLVAEPIAMFEMPAFCNRDLCVHLGSPSGQMVTELSVLRAATDDTLWLMLLPMPLHDTPRAGQLTTWQFKPWAVIECLNTLTLPPLAM
ncbi:hypothetical protein EMCRGX_G024279 [Ephydatia muelleri]